MNNIKELPTVIVEFSEDEIELIKSLEAPIGQVNTRTYQRFGLSGNTFTGAQNTYMGIVRAIDRKLKGHPFAYDRVGKFSKRKAALEKLSAKCQDIADNMDDIVSDYVEDQNIYLQQLHQMKEESPEQKQQIEKLLAERKKRIADEKAFNDALSKASQDRTQQVIAEKLKQQAERQSKQ